MLKRRCRNCGELGHNVRTCTERPKPVPSNLIVRVVFDHDALQRKVDTFAKTLDERREERA
jgi:hypothetical protein